MFHTTCQEHDTISAVHRDVLTTAVMVINGQMILSRLSVSDSSYLRPDRVLSEYAFAIIHPTTNPLSSLLDTAPVLIPSTF